MFENMISKTLIEWLWVGWSFLVGIAGVIAMTQAGGLGGALLVLLGTVLGLMLVRVICEGMIVVFLIHEDLQQSSRSLTSIESSQIRIISRLGSSDSPARTATAAASNPTSVSAPGSARLATPSPRAGWDTAYASTSDIGKDS